MSELNNLQAQRLLICGMILLAAGSAVARQDAPPPSKTHESMAVDALMILELEPIFPETLLAEDAAKASRQPGPLKTHGTWEELDDGGRLWRLRITSPNATDLNFGFTRFRLPEGATLHLVSEDHDYYQGPYGAMDNRDHGELWTPVIPGERAVIELYVPPDPAFEPQLVLGRVGRGFRDLFGTVLAAEKQGSCNIDVICGAGDGFPWVDEWRAEIQSVARYSISGFAFCTGSLIMDAPNSFKPYFLSAFHCEITESNDQSVVTYWNYQSPECGQLGGGSLNQSVSGSTFIATQEAADFVLVELDSTPPPEVNPYWAGWDRNPPHNPQGSVCIHHPNADEKAISLNTDPLTIVSQFTVYDGDGNVSAVVENGWRVNNWQEGTTEAGSSGAGLWDSENHLLVGTLSGGSASCDKPEGSDYFGNLTVGWDGAEPDQRLRDWLDPDDTGVETVAGRFLTGAGSHFSCGNAGYDGNNPVSAAFFDGGQAGNDDLMYAVRIRLADFGYEPEDASNQLNFTADGGPWSNEVFVYPDDGGTPDESVILAQGTIVTGDGSGDSVVNLDQVVLLDGDFWLIVRGDPKHTGEDFNVEFDKGPNTGNSYVSTTGIDGLTISNNPSDFPNGVNYLLRAKLQSTKVGMPYNYIVGGVASTRGSNETEWHTKLALLNRSGAPASVTLSYVRFAKTASSTIIVADKELRSWDDVVKDLFGITDETTGAVKVESDRPLLVTARTYNLLDEGTVGQFYPGVESSLTLGQGETGLISQLTKNADFRTNIGFVNLADSECHVRLELFSDFGAQVGSTRNLTVPPMGWMQDNDSFKKAGAGTQDNAYATVDVRTIGCQVWGYASVVDNVTGDPTTIPMEPE